MKLRHNDIVIPDDGSDPFVHCKLDRKKYAGVLTSIVSGYSDGFVLAIDNTWGTGKTTFVKMWRQHLKNEEFQTLYFNAWENDFQEEVIIALLSELEELKHKAATNFNTLLEKTATFLKKVAPSVAKGVVSKAIGDDAIGDIAQAATEFTTEEVELQIKNFSDKKKGIQDFRNVLEKFVQEVDDEKPVVFIIDELDRCRPSYAVEVLEQIKHLFSVPGIVFVLSIDKVQLGNAIRGFYGSDRIDADEYLRRFIDLEYKIPTPDIESFIEYLYEYFEFDQFINAPERVKVEQFQPDESILRTVALLLYTKSGFSLRQIEKRFARIRLTLRAFNHQQFLFPEVIILLSYLDAKHSEVLDKIRNLSYSLQELINELDTILITLSTTNEEITSSRSTMASLLCLYETSCWNVLEIKPKGLFNHTNLLVPTLRITSKLDGSNDELLKIITFYKSNFHSPDKALNFILDKYDLTENLRT